jgi:hypothetical protein
MLYVDFREVIFRALGCMNRREREPALESALSQKAD